jgi:hypothetical protein
MLVGPNAGLPAYPEWVPTLQSLASMRPVPACLFTDYCEEAAVQGGRMAAAVAGMQPGPAAAVVNPFRDVSRLGRHGNALPAYSNAFGFWLTAG